MRTALYDLKTAITTQMLIGLVSIASATTWSEVKVKDPVSGVEVDVWEIASYGSYVFEWPSKYDGIYWPLTDKNFIRFSPESGYIAFGSDFEEITDEGRQRVQEFLEEHYDKEKQPSSHEEKLDWLGRVYEARGAAALFWMRYHCLRAYLSRSTDAACRPHREKALKSAEEARKGLADGAEQAGAIYILAAQSLMLGNAEKAAGYLEELQNLKWESEPGEATWEDLVEHYVRAYEEIRSGSYKKEYLGNE